MRSGARRVQNYESGIARINKYDSLPIVGMLRIVAYYKYEILYIMENQHRTFLCMGFRGFEEGGGRWGWRAGLGLAL